MPLPRIGATLAFRNLESRTYTIDLPETAPNLYAVALVDARFPWKQIAPSSPYVVACLEYTTWTKGEGWGWTHLDPDTKYAIGHDLTEMEAEIGQWYYLVIGTQEAVSTTREGPATMTETRAPHATQTPVDRDYNRGLGEILSMPPGTEKAIQLAVTGLQTEGTDHKHWALLCILRALGINPEEPKRQLQQLGHWPWGSGIAPEPD